MHTRVWTRIDSPIGDLTIVAENDAIVAIEMSPARPATTASAVRDDAHPLLSDARRQLDAYFRGELTTFSLPLRPSGTDFQRRVWKALERIPYGGTASYGDIAKAIGAPGSSRAVGAANGANPLPIVVPCHRVIGSDGSLTGYGGGLDRKRKLLALETVALRQWPADTDSIPPRRRDEDIETVGTSRRSVEPRAAGFRS